MGIYVPGGTAVLPSSALMLAVPALIAGCATIVLATPPRPDGSISPEVLWCAHRAGVTHVLLAGGAQAVAAMAWGTASCPKVCWAPALHGPRRHCACHEGRSVERGLTDCARHAAWQGGGLLVHGQVIMGCRGRQQ